MTSAVVREVQWRALRVSPKTVWSFVELVDSEGRTGVGEATLGGRELATREYLSRLAPAIVGRPIDADLDTHRAAATSLPEFAVVSALDQALWDLVAQSNGVSVGEALGGRRRESIPVYANINRGIALRTEQGFAEHAQRAVADGFSAIKIAPFDGVELYGDDGRDADPTLVDAGLARIAAVREAVGPSVHLMVDCHWRLNRRVAEHVLAATSSQALYWLECPVPETPEMLGTLRHLRKLANARGTRLAGCEEMSRVAGFTPFLDAGAYDVMMPDVKYVGGLREMLDVAEAFRRGGVAFSPHNPSGPVCHAASLQVCAATPVLERLEMQYAETPLFDQLVEGALPPPVEGRIAVPRVPGVGVRFDRTLAQNLSVAEASLEQSPHRGRGNR